MTRNTKNQLFENGSEEINMDEYEKTFPFLKDEDHRAFVKSYISLAPDLDTADACIVKFGKIDPDDDSLECFGKKVFFLKGLYPYRKLAGCDPDDASDLDKLRVDYWGMLAPVIGLR